MNKDARITIRLSPKLEKQLTVLQKSLYQTQKIANKKGERSKQAKELSISQVAKIVLENNFKQPDKKIKFADDIDITEEEEVEAEMFRVGADIWKDDKLLDKELVINEELEEFDELWKKSYELRKKSLTPSWSQKDKKELEKVNAKIDIVNKRTEEEIAEADRDRGPGRYRGKRKI